MSGDRGLPPEDVKAYPRPAVAERVSHRITAVFAGQSIVDTTRAIRVLETHHAPTYYIPPADISANLVPVTGRSFCEWKGAATYYDVVGGGQRAVRAAWSYDRPSQGFASLAGFVAFYAGKLDACYVNNVRVLPQDGDFYGGWITPNLIGTVKGAPGTERW